MNTTKSQSPEETLLAFFTAMNQWERNANFRSDQIGRGELTPHEAARLNREEIDVVFLELCVPRDYSESGTSYQWPCEYGVETEKIVEVKQVKGTRVEIYTQQTHGMQYKRVFTLEKTPDGWRVARKYRINPAGKKVREIF